MYSSSLCAFSCWIETSCWKKDDSRTDKKVVRQDRVSLSFIGRFRWIVGSPVLQSALTTLVVVVIVVVPLPLLLALLFPFAVDSQVYREDGGNPVDGSRRLGILTKELISCHLWLHPTQINRLWDVYVRSLAWSSSLSMWYPSQRLLILSGRSRGACPCHLVSSAPTIIIKLLF
jgi:hypothetical protein